MEKLIETRGRRERHTYPHFEVGQTYQFTAYEPSDIKDGAATPAYASRVVARVLHYSRRHNLGWKIARRTFGTTVEVTILA